MPRRRALILASIAALAASASASAQDAGLGAEIFERCAACHAIVAPDGEVLRGGGRVGPNLYDVPGRQAGTGEAFPFSPWLEEAGRTGLVWTEAHFADYLRNPTRFIQRWLDDESARARMAFRLTEDAEDVFAYLRAVSRGTGS